jgi:hypothetical protein
VARIDEDAFETELTDCALGFLDEGGTAARENGGEGIEHALVLLLHLGGVVGPLLHRRQLLARRLAAQIVRGIGDDADVDAVLVVRLEKILEHHGAAALAPLRAALAVVGAEVVGRFFRCVDVRMPVDDHACLLLFLFKPRSAGTGAARCRGGWR